MITFLDVSFLRNLSSILKITSDNATSHGNKPTIKQFPTSEKYSHDSSIAFAAVIRSHTTVWLQLFSSFTTSFSSSCVALFRFKCKCASLALLEFTINVYLLFVGGKFPCRYALKHILNVVPSTEASYSNLFHSVRKLWRQFSSNSDFSTGRSLWLGSWRWRLLKFRTDNTKFEI